MTDEEAVKAATIAQSPMNSSGVPPIPKEAQEWLKSQGLDQALNHPLSQFSLVLVSDPAFRGAVGEINQKFHKNTVIGYEIAWILLIWVFRAWRLTKAGTWLTRIWTQAWVSVVFWWGVLFLVPWLLWGKSYQMLLSTVIRALIHQFWT